MTWQSELCAATDTWLEFMNSIESLASSKHVSAAAVNNPGTGYAVGDILTITHASAAILGGVTLSCRIEVLSTTTGPPGPIDTFRIINGGSFAQRLASAVVGAVDGAAYAVDDIIEVDDGVGASFSKSKVRVTGVTSGNVDTVAVYEHGGAYTTTPTTNEATTRGIGRIGGTFAGDDLLTLDLTMQAIIGTTGIAATGGTGSSATFNLTLSDGGWTILHSENNHSVDSLTHMKEVVMIGTASEGDAPILGFQTFRNDFGGSIKNYGIACFGMTAFNPGLALQDQPGLGPILWTTDSTSGSHIPVAEEVAEGNLWGVSVTPARICGYIRTNIAAEAIAYHTFYTGFLNRFGTATTTPYPMFVGASSNESNRRPFDLDSTALAEARGLTAQAGPLYFFQQTTLTWLPIYNSVSGSENQNYIMWPRGVMAEASGNENLLIENDNIFLFNDPDIMSIVRATVSGKIFPSPGSTNIYGLIPLTVASTGGSGTNGVNTRPIGELDGVFFTGGVDDTGAIFSSEDILEQGGVRYILIQSVPGSVTGKPYQFMAIRMD